MNDEFYYKAITKLIGNINPVGETNTDNERFENLKNMCELVEKLLFDVEDMAHRNKYSHEFSVKRASEYAYDFCNKLGINN